LRDTGEFRSEELESNYQKYLKRKKRENKTPRDRLDWKEVREYHMERSNMARGNKFNKSIISRDLYKYHEVHLKNGYRLDSYNKVTLSDGTEKWEIISRKATDLDKIKMETFEGYLKEFEVTKGGKYKVGTEIRSNKYKNELDGKKLEGEYILEIPKTNESLPNIKDFEDIAKKYNVTLRFTEE
ncbi:MAG: hypothetical protein KIC92_10095, partial [Clostridiales bacterium]|nr:hypothetical protein [Clostridiales bacterium]